MSIPLRTRLYVEDALSASATVALSPAQAHYLRNVLRLTLGVELAAFNGRDGEWRAKIEALSKDNGVIRVEEQVSVIKHSPDIWLLFAPIKRQGIDLIAEKATELGVSRLQPVHTKYTVVTRVNTERMQANAIEAAQQCQRHDVPEVCPPLSLSEVLKSWPAERTLFVCVESGEGREDIDAALKASRRGEPAAILVSSEGGFAQSEISLLSSLPYVRLVHLGPRILRSETACIAALTCWQMICGDWNTPS